MFVSYKGYDGKEGSCVKLYVNEAEVLSLSSRETQPWVLLPIVISIVLMGQMIISLRVRSW